MIRIICGGVILGASIATTSYWWYHRHYPSRQHSMKSSDEITTLTKQQVIELRKAHLSRGLRPSYQSPVLFLQGEAQYLYDERGVRYLDAYNNVLHVGHCHADVIEATSSQLLAFNSNTRYLHPNITLLAKKLTSKLPSKLSVCFFVNSGSEANDLAIRLARIYTKKKGIICLENAYHGTTISVVKVSPTKSYGQGSMIAPKHVLKVPTPDTYKGLYRDEDASRKYAAHVESAIAEFQAKGQNFAAFIHESIQGVGGQVVYPPGYLAQVYEIVHRAGGVTIADEVQTGFGRTGKYYWAFESQEVIPDIVTLGKPFANGLPIGCVVTTKEISEAFSEEEYFSTFGGNPVVMAAGLAVMNVIENENLQQNAEIVGNWLLQELAKLKLKYKCIGEVRGIGFFIGIEFSVDGDPSKPATQLTREICNSLKDDYQILTGFDGPGKNVLRIKPPLCFSKQNAEYLLRSLELILQKKDNEK